MKHLLYTLLFVIALSAQAQKKAKQIDIITDTRFSNGINLIGENSSRPDVIDTLYPFGKSKLPPEWKLAQWATRFDLKGIKPSKDLDTIIYQNAGKKITFLRGKRSVLVGLEVFGGKEYLSPRKATESWPHLLLEQRTNHTPIAQMNKLNYSISARLIHTANLNGADYDPGLHAAQVTLYLLVQNINKTSAGIGDYFWFGLPLYDSRHEMLEEYAAQDLGKEDATKKFILNVASKELFKGSLHAREWIHIKKDIYPLLINAFRIAKANGYLKATSIDDIAIESTNLGWEIPGTYNAGIQFENLSLKAELE